jgi:hypothetical protein
MIKTMPSNNTPEVFALINKERYTWLLGYTKMIEKKHSGIKYGYETEDNTWRIFSRNGTLLIMISFNLDSKYIVYSYLNETNGNLSLKSKNTRSLKDLKSILTKLEDINAFDK